MQMATKLLSEGTTRVGHTRKGQNQTMELFPCRQPESRCELGRSETTAAGTVALVGGQVVCAATRPVILLFRREWMAEIDVWHVAGEGYLHGRRDDG